MGLRILVPVSCGTFSIGKVDANETTENDWGGAGVNITQVGDFTKADYKYKLTPLFLVKPLVWLGVGVGKVHF